MTAPPQPTTAARLRPGQSDALTRYAAALRGGSRSELVVVPVGYGKTVIGVGSFEVAASLVDADTCLYLTPTDVLRTQVYGGVERALTVIGGTRPIRKILADNAAPQRIRSTGANFIVASYQQIAAAPAQYARLCQDRRVHIVCDEAHHLGERGTWAAAVPLDQAASSILLSAAPVRLDRDAIAGARYIPDEDGALVIDPLVNVTMRQAWKERRILKYLNVQMKDYAVQLRDARGELYEFSASEMAELPDFDQRCVRDQLRWNEDYVAPLVREFATTLLAKMRAQPRQHQGLVFAATTEHANHLERVFGTFHPGLRCTVIHSGDIADSENARRLGAFHKGEYDVLIQVKKASEGFDAPTVSVLLKLDAIHSREPVVQQLGRGLRYHHALPEPDNLLNVFIGRDPRLGSLIEHLEREAPPIPLPRQDPSLLDDGDITEREDQMLDEDESRRPEVVDVVEAGDAYLDHTGRFVEGQQITMFGVIAPPVKPSITAAVDVVDIATELQDAIAYCTTWTNRAAKERARRARSRENHYAALNLAYGRETNRRGALATPAEYRHKGDWMKRRYTELLG